jgi:murein DD-endopeptidase MepM/ murein hydrolase activator NlpD
MRFHPIVMLPPDAVVLDLTESGDFQTPDSRWTVGRYNEDRAIYTQPLFAESAEPRTVHLGIDLGGPEGVAVHAFSAGIVRFATDNDKPGDYGPTLITEHEVNGAPLWVLHGHLSRSSLAHSPVGRRLRPGDVLGWLGGRHENGGWAPHVHVQVTRERPEGPDLPGVARRSERAAALARFPDPQTVLGPLCAWAG